ncbi:MAG: serine/threonine-protein kinase [Myxococcota bacterium]
MSRIASGGAGSVFLARDQRDNCDVVVKFIDAREDAMDGWVREMRIALRLSHPSVVQCRTVGYDENLGAWALVYDYASGGSLRRALVQDRTLSVEGAVELLRDISSALSYAHRQGVIHRDVKPENIVKRFSDADGWQLTDFGDSRFLARGSIAETVVGSLSYMAPETFVGKSTHLSDQYALGVVVVECLRGAIQSRRQLRSIEATSVLEAVLQQMLAPHPSDRFPNIDIVHALSGSDFQDTQWLTFEGECALYDGSEIHWQREDVKHSGAGLRFERFVRCVGAGLGAKVGHRLVRLGETRRTVYADESPYTALCFNSSGDGWILKADQLCRISAQGIEATCAARGLFDDTESKPRLAWGDRRRIVAGASGCKTLAVAYFSGSELVTREVGLALPLDTIGSHQGEVRILAADHCQTAEYTVTDSGELRELNRYPVPSQHARYVDGEVSLVRSFDTAEFFSRPQGGRS